jgi:hypothetical protein
VALNNAGLDAFTVGGTLPTHASLHTATPNGSGSNESTAGREPISWTGPTNGGDMAASGPIAFTGGAASGPIVAVGLWTAETGGTYLGSLTTSGATAFNAEGAATVTALTVPATSS